MRTSDCWVCAVNYVDNPWFDDVLEKERVKMLKRDPVGYKTTWEGQCRPAVEGAIYANEIGELIGAKRIRNVPYDPMLKVHWIWDLGWNDQTCIIGAQRTGSEIAIADYIEGDHRTLADYAQDDRERKYNLGTLWLPHDGESKNLQTGKSPKEVLIGLGFDVQIVPDLSVEQGIHAARLLFPRCYFDKDKTAQLTNGLKRYRRQMNQATGTFGAPLHDQASNPADAFRYLAIVADKADAAPQGRVLLLRRGQGGPGPARDHRPLQRRRARGAQHHRGHAAPADGEVHRRRHGGGIRAHKTRGRAEGQAMHRLLQSPVLQEEQRPPDHLHLVQGRPEVQARHPQSLVGHAHEETREEYRGVDQIELAQIWTTTKSEITEQKSYPDEEDAEQRQKALEHLTSRLDQAQQAAQQGNQQAAQAIRFRRRSQHIMQTPPAMLFDMVCKRTKKGGKVCIENVPPEEFGISARRRWTSGSPSWAIGSRAPCRASSMGYKKRR
jgi:soluble cytochrome b562